MKRERVMGKIIVKIVLSVIFVGYFGTSMWYCFIAGAPSQKESLILYMISGVVLAFAFPIIVCLQYHYIQFLKKYRKD